PYIIERSALGGVTAMLSSPLMAGPVGPSVEASASGWLLSGGASAEQPNSPRANASSSDIRCTVRGSGLAPGSTAERRRDEGILMIHLLGKGLQARSLVETDVVYPEVKIRIGHRVHA